LFDFAHKASSELTIKPLVHYMLDMLAKLSTANAHDQPQLKVAQMLGSKRRDTFSCLLHRAHVGRVQIGRPWLLG